MAKNLKPRGKSATRTASKSATRTASKSATRTDGKSATRNSSSKGYKNTEIQARDEYLTGRLEVTSKGYGFLICEGRNDDVFIPPSKMNGALNNDLVEVRVYLYNNKTEGEVIEVKERKTTRIVGTFKTYGKASVVEPDDVRLCQQIAISKSDTKRAEDGDKVVVEITSFDRMLGKVIEVMGQADERGVDIMSIVRSYNLYETFPSSVEREAESISEVVIEDEINGRRDFRDELIITIDGDDSRDFDDAVTVKKQEDGGFVLGVHIADVAHYVKAQSKLDIEAYKRGTSVYFPELVLPMLPKKLSNGICSLNENVDRLTLSLIMSFDKSGEVIKHTLKEGVIRSRHRMTYSVVSSILDGSYVNADDKYKDIIPMLFEMKELAQILQKRRKERGAIDFDVSESEIKLDESGRTVDIVKKPRLVSHRIIEEFMLIANETIARLMFNNKAPFVYRVHEEPPALKMEGFMEFLSALGLDFSFNNDVPSPKEMSQFLESVPENLTNAVSRVGLRTMSKATYEPQNRGHYGLSAEYYCHFTSPIRRYPDLLIHRIIKDFLKNGKKCFKKYEAIVEPASKQSSETERIAEKVERDVDDLKKAQFMEDKIGQCFDGIISGVTEFGLFVELDNSVEGLVRIESLRGEGFVFNPKALTIKNAVKSYTLGQKVSIEVEAVNGSRVSFLLENN